MNYMPQLDGLRAIAVGAVAVQHWGGGQLRIFGFSTGTLGVGIFFVLSGFLITNILLSIRISSLVNASNAGLLRFWLRRALRIFPVFYFTILFGVILNIPGIVDYWPWHVLYGSNFLFSMKDEVGYATHFWTLAVEEQFYLFWPLVILYVPTRAVPYVIVSCILSAIAWRYLASAALIPLGPLENPSPLLPSHLDYLCLGALLSWIVANPRVVNPALFCKAVGLIGAAGILVFSQIEGFWTLNVACLAMVFCATVFWASQGNTGSIGKMLELGPVVYLGKISYGIYILHMLAPFLWDWLFYSAPIPGSRVFLRFGIPQELSHHAVLLPIVWTFITVGLASASWFLIEAPISRLKRHFPYNSVCT